MLGGEGKKDQGPTRTVLIENLNFGVGERMLLEALQISNDQVCLCIAVCGGGWWCWVRAKTKDFFVDALGCFSHAFECLVECLVCVWSVSCVCVVSALCVCGQVSGVVVW